MRLLSKLSALLFTCVLPVVAHSVPVMFDFHGQLTWPTGTFGEQPSIDKPLLWGGTLYTAPLPEGTNSSPFRFAFVVDSTALTHSIYFESGSGLDGYIIDGYGLGQNYLQVYDPTTGGLTLSFLLYGSGGEFEGMLLCGSGDFDEQLYCFPGTFRAGTSIVDAAPFSPEEAVPGLHYQSGISGIIASDQSEVAGFIVFVGDYPDVSLEGTLDITVLPLPSSGILLIAGLASLGLAHRRRRSKC